MSAFVSPLSEELREYRGTRVNALASAVGERAAALRYALERVDEQRCDGYATTDSPLEAGTPVEVKSVRVSHAGGRTGRLGVHPGSHAALEDAGGYYAVVLYGEVDVDGRRIVALAMDLVDAATVGRQLPRNPSGYAKVRWDVLLDPAAVDVARWSG